METISNPVIDSTGSLHSWSSDDSNEEFICISEKNLHSKIKILYILPYDWGGMPHYTAELANAMAKYADVTIIGSKRINSEYFSADINIEKLFDPLNFTMNQLRGILSLDSLKGLLSYKYVREIDRVKPDIIHIPAPVIPPLAVFIKLYNIDKKYPIIYTKHSLYSQSGLLITILEQSILGQFERHVNFKKFIVHTEHDKNELVKETSIKDEDISIVPHGTYTFFKPDSDPEAIEGVNTIIFFGNIRKYKGLDYLLKAIPLIQKEIPDIKVIIAGEGDLSPYQSLIEVCDKSVFDIYNEFIPDELVTELFQRSTLAVLPYSEMSGMSGVLNVAFAFGKPVVVSDVGGLDEVVEHEKTGLLVPPTDYQALADAIIRLLTDPILRSMIVANVKKRADDLSWANVAKRTMKVYQEVKL